MILPAANFHIKKSTCLHTLENDLFGAGKPDLLILKFPELQNEAILRLSTVSLHQ
jgi:hypothetical protein